MNKKSKTILLVDGYHLLHKGYYGTLKRKKISYNRDKISINAVFAFVSNINKLINKNEYHTIIVALDTKSKDCWRKSIYNEYKAKRSKTPVDLKFQMQIIREFLKLSKIPCYELNGYEGDDIIGTITNRALKYNFNIEILSNDKDIYQLVNDNVHVISNMKKGDENKIIDIPTVKDEFGCMPKQISDYKSLLGDSSDNIRGVQNMDRKIVLNLLNKYVDINDIYNNIDQMPKFITKILEKNKEKIELNKKLTTICTDLDIGYVNFNKLNVNYKGMLYFLKKQKMYSFIRIIPKEYINNN